jgi:hypothetical protein
MTISNGNAHDPKASKTLAGSAVSPFEAPLTPGWAFVIQLRRGTRFTAEQLCGRIEHVVSGRACLFDSLEGARTFMELVMTNGLPDPSSL